MKNKNIKLLGIIIILTIITTINFIYQNNNKNIIQPLGETKIQEEDQFLAVYINGELSTTFPTTNNYSASVICTTNSGTSNATGTVSWNGTKWILSVTGADSGKTVCNIYFKEPTLKDLILAQGGDTTTIEAKGTPDFSVINGTSGLYASEDEYGMSYYYRGLKTELNNNLIFGGFQWKIIRINGDGSIRVIYNGTEAQFNSSSTMNTTGLNTNIGNSIPWNNTYCNDVKYVGYMYGGANGVASTVRNGTISAAATYNETSSNVKVQLDNWYQNNIYGKAFENNIVDNIFCNDRQLEIEVGGSSGAPGLGYGDPGTYTFYAAYHRLESLREPMLKCGLKNDRFTKNDTIIGNGALTYQIGTITADETAMAGLVVGKTNSTNYLYTNERYWTSSPYGNVSWYEGQAQVIYVYITGNLSFNNVNSTIGLRPVLNLKGELKVTGEGTATNPFRVN